MSIFQSHFGSSYQMERIAPIWFIALKNPKTINEGESSTVTLRIVNYRPGARIIWWMIGGATSSGRWLKSWQSLITEVCNANGINVRRLTTTTTPASRGTFDFELTIPEGSTYAGQELVFTNTTRRNNKNDTDPTTGQLVLLAKVNSADEDIGRVASGGNSLSIRDTSKRPLYTPTYRLTFKDEDGVGAVPGKLRVGTTIKMIVDVRDPIPGTKIKIYAADVAQNYFNPSFKTALQRAAQDYIAAGNKGLGIEINKYSTKPGAPPYYNGHTLVYEEGYDNTKPLELYLTVGKVEPNGDPLDVSIVSTITAQGTVADLPTSVSKGDWVQGTAYSIGDFVTYVPNGLKYVATSTIPTTATSTPEQDTNNWREYVGMQSLASSASFVIQDYPERYWEIEARTDGTTITYTIVHPLYKEPEYDENGNSILRPEDIVYLKSTNEPVGFEAALIEAYDTGMAPFIGTYTPGTRKLRSIFPQRGRQVVTFTVPHPQGEEAEGKHLLELVDRNPGSAYISVNYACVYLKKPTINKPVSFIAGVNAASAEFTTSRVPGTYGSDYVYPSFPERSAPRNHEYLDYLWRKGCKDIRVPIKWGRIQREPYGPLWGERAPDATSWSGNSYDIARIDELIDYWTVQKDGTIFLDIHNYGGGPQGGKIRFDYDLDPSGKDLPVEALCDVWIKLAARYENNPRVFMDLMNEPNGAGWSAERCRTSFQTVVNAIRSFTNNTNIIAVPGTSWSSAYEWVTNGQGEAFERFHDPADNVVFTCHNYFDATRAGTSGVCAVGGESQLTRITNWARANGKKIYMGEIAGGDPNISGQEACKSVLEKSYQYMWDNRDVWFGWTTWGSGPFWHATYIFRLNPSNYTETGEDYPLMKILIPYLGRIE